MTASRGRRASPRGGAIEALGWGIFCASSWAWCIGLFLPTVLRRLLGWPGFIAFAIPNVLGCAAFGFVLDLKRSRRLQRDHRGAMVLFSAVTIAYQLLLAGWTASALLGPMLGGHGQPVSWQRWAACGIGLGCAGTIGLAVSFARDRLIPAIAAVAWLLSAGVLGFTVFDVAPIAMPEPELAAAQVWGLLPALLLGFLLCPYLDLTFHRALRHGPRRATFATFGVTFATLIVLVAFLADPEGPLGIRLTPLVLAQLWVQLGFTIGAHSREIRLATQHAPGPMPRWITPSAIAAGAILALPGIAGEPNYLRMLGWYGLVFPAYVLLAMVGERRKPMLRTWLLLAVVLAIGLPLYERGISAFEFGWMAIPAPILLASAWWLRRRSSGSASAGK
jgi:hypothetical protein